VNLPGQQNAPPERGKAAKKRNRLRVAARVGQRQYKPDETYPKREPASSRDKAVKTSARFELYIING